MSDALTRLATRMGVVPSYEDLDRQTHATGRETQIAVLQAMGIEAETENAARDHLAALDGEQRLMWRVVEAGAPMPADLVDGSDWAIAFEEGREAEGGPSDLPNLPLGRHHLTVGARRVWLLAAPPSLPVPRRGWGVTAPLPGLRTEDEGGVGSYVDLARAAEAFAGSGAGFLGINPVHAGFPADDNAFSPYSPSHRGWLNTLHIEVEGRAAETGPLIDYPAAIRAQRQALRGAFEGQSDPEFDAFLAEKGEALERFALHQALSEKYGAYWSDWPANLRTWKAARVSQERQALAPDVRFHAWAQFLAERQLGDAAMRAEGAGMGFGLYLDLAVGVHWFGAETWETPELFAKGASLGAPPDSFSPAGQNWSLAPFIPHNLEAEGFASFAAILRRQFQFAKLVRIDHILGFERAFWALDADVPGAYVAMPREALLAVTRIEAARAGVTVIGEDLGNIPSGLQSALKASGLLGCRLMVFERAGGGFKRAGAYEPNALASFSTHDLATWEGWQKGLDIEAQLEVGQIGKAQRDRALAGRTDDVAALRTVIGSGGIHGFLADCASHLVAVQAENLFEVEDQANLPGTVDAYPNWRRRLPVRIEDYAGDPRLALVGQVMGQAGR